MKEEQLLKHIKKINRYSTLTSFVIVLAAFIIRFMATAEETQQYMFQFAYTVIFLLLIVHLKANNLKQKAIIRYITGSISDHDF